MHHQVNSDMPTPEEIAHIRKELSSWSRKRQSAMLEQVRALSYEDKITAVVELFAVSPSRIKQYKQSTYRTIGVAMMAIALGSFAAYKMIVLINPSFPQLLGIAPALAILQVAHMRHRPFSNAAHILLDGLSDKRLVAPLLQSLQCTDPSFAPPLHNALAASLPLLDGDAYSALALAERNMLIAQSFARNSRLQMTTLMTLQRLDVTSALPYVERLLKRNPEFEVARAALRCQTHLLEVSEAQKVGDSLLRPSQKDDQPDTLLRTANRSDDEDERQLLRPEGKQ